MFDRPAKIEYLPIAPERRVLVVAHLDLHGQRLGVVEETHAAVAVGDGDSVAEDDQRTTGDEQQGVGEVRPEGGGGVGCGENRKNGPFHQTIPHGTVGKREAEAMMILIAGTFICNYNGALTGEISDNIIGYLGNLTKS